jgi:hypothetical protein
VYGNAQVSDDAQVSGNAWVYGNARVSGSAWVYGDARVSGDAWVYGDARVSGDARVYGDARVSGSARVSGDADYVLIGPMGTRKAFTTFCKDKDKNIIVFCGCWSGTIEVFEKRIEDVHGDNAHGKSYRAAINFAKTVMQIAIPGEKGSAQPITNQGGNGLK